jgi:hypothetical protein
MDRLFLDANILFSAAYRPNAGLLKFWRLPDVQLCSSRYALEEARSNLTEAAQRHRLDRLSADLSFFDSASHQPPRGVNLPEKDIPIALISSPAICATLGLTSAKNCLGFLFSSQPNIFVSAAFGDGRSFSVPCRGVACCYAIHFFSAD